MAFWEPWIVLFRVPTHIIRQGYASGLVTIRKTTSTLWKMWGKAWQSPNRISSLIIRCTLFLKWHHWHHQILLSATLSELEDAVESIHSGIPPTKMEVSSWENDRTNGQCSGMPCLSTEGYMVSPGITINQYQSLVITILCFIIINGGISQWKTAHLGMV